MFANKKCFKMHQMATAAVYFEMEFKHTPVYGDLQIERASGGEKVFWEVYIIVGGGTS